MKEQKNLLEKELTDLCGKKLKNTENPYNKLTEKIVVSPGAIDELPAIIKALCPEKSVTMICDDNTWNAVGERADSVLADKGFSCEILNLEPENIEIVEPLQETVDSLKELIAPDTNAILTVGSGTITDIGKALAAESGKPQIALVSAPSVNGFTSSFSSLIRNGLKTTFPAPSPVIVVADIGIFQNAPKNLIAAGFADLCSRTVSGPDWHIAAQIYDMPYREEAIRLASISFDAIKGIAEGIQKRDAAALTVLTNALMLSGFSMCLAGSSSPASGGEHLISHYWDMTAIKAGVQPPSLHGLQVGIASLMTSSLFELLSAINCDDIDIEKLISEYPTDEEFAEALKWRHGELYEIVKNTALKKFVPSDIQRKRLERLKERWDDMWEKIKPEFLPPTELLSLLEKAACPTLASEINLSRSEVTRAFLNARDIRLRFSILDVAFDLGLLEEIVDEAINLSGVAPE
ncbi:MAG: hypothetical protein Kow0090_04540 [Myxococcota bacterium]